VRQPARTVDAGYIVYVAKGEDPAPERAQFKAEAQAFEDLSNECSFAPKGARVEDRFDRVTGGIHQSYAKVAVDFQSCEEAKAATQPDQIQKLANVAVTEEIKRYQEMTEQEPPPDLAVASNGAPPPAQPGMPPPPPPPGGYYGGGGTVVVVQDEPSYFLMREQVAYYKQTVILPPPPGVAPPPPAQVTQVLSGPTTQLQTFEKAHPVLRTNQQAWSQVRGPLGRGIRAQQFRGRPPANRGSFRRPPPLRRPPQKKRKRWKNGHWE
jgi:hypothetical protein